MGMISAGSSTRSMQSFAGHMWRPLVGAHLDVLRFLPLFSDM